MGLTESILFSVSVVVLPLFAQRKYNTPSTLFVIAALVYLAFGAIGYYLGAATPVNESAFHNTYIIQNSPNTYSVVSTLHYRVNIAIILAISAALLWAQQKLRALRFKRITILLFWIMNLGLLILDITQNIMKSSLLSASNIANNISHFKFLTLLTSWASLAGSAVLPALVVSFMVSILLRLVRGSN